MASKSKSRPASRRPAQSKAGQFQPQDLIFAGIGAVSLGRKEAARLYAKAGPAARLFVAYARDAQEQAVIAAGKAQSKVLSFAAKAETNARKKLAKAESEARKQLAKAESEARKQFGPVLVKLGIAKKPAVKRATRKAAPRRRRAA